MKLESSSSNSLKAAMETSNQYIIKSFSFYFTDWHEGEKNYETIVVFGWIVPFNCSAKRNIDSFSQH